MLRYHTKCLKIPYTVYIFSVDSLRDISISLKTLQGFTLSLQASIVSVHGPKWIVLKSLKLLNIDFNADPDPDPDPAFHSSAGGRSAVEVGDGEPCAGVELGETTPNPTTYLRHIQIATPPLLALPHLIFNFHFDTDQDPAPRQSDANQQHWTTVLIFQGSRGASTAPL